MKLGEFIEKFIEHNSIVRLVYKDKSGHRIVQKSWSDVSMDHQILKGKGINRHYIGNEVLGVCSILTVGHFPEAINIVIEQMDNQPFIEEPEEQETAESCTI